MSKFSLKGTLIIGIALSTFTSCTESDQHHFSEKGVHHITVKKGSVFEFSLPQNKSTGYELCWLNEAKLSARYQLSSIKSKLKDANNVDGGGETISYQILANEIGTDTLRFQNCPTRLWQKDCAFFAVDSTYRQENGVIISSYAPNQKGDFEIVVKVED